VVHFVSPPVPPSSRKEKDLEEEVEGEVEEEGPVATSPLH
jgi:hypothetical protein